MGIGLSLLIRPDACPHWGAISFRLRLARIRQTGYTPYRYVPSDTRVFKPEDTFDRTDPKFERRRKVGPVVKTDDPDYSEWLRNR